MLSKERNFTFVQIYLINVLSLNDSVQNFKMKRVACRRYQTNRKGWKMGLVIKAMTKNNGKVCVSCEYKKSLRWLRINV